MQVLVVVKKVENLSIESDSILASLNCLGDTGLG